MKIPLTALKDKQSLALVLLAICAVAVQALMLFGRSVTFQPDAGSYIAYADALLAKLDFSVFDTHRTPGYPVLLMPIFSIFTDNASFGVRLVQHVFALLTIACVYRIARLLHDSFYFACGATLLSCFSLQIWAYADCPMSEMTYTMLATSSLMFALLFNRTKSMPYAIASCGIVGLATMVRPQGQYLVLLPLLFVALHGWNSYRASRTKMQCDKAWSGKKFATALLLSVLSYSMFVVPWMYHNYTRNGVFSMGGSLGINLYSRLIDFDDLIDLNSPSVQLLKTTWERDRDQRLAEGKFIAPNESWRHHWPVAGAYLRMTNATMSEIDALMLQAAKDCLRIYYKEYLWETAKIIWKHHSSYEPLYLYIPGGLDENGKQKYPDLMDISISGNKGLHPKSYAGLKRFVINEPPTFLTPVYAKLAEAYFAFTVRFLSKIAAYQFVGYLSILFCAFYGPRRAEWFIFLCYLAYGIGLPPFLVPASPRHRMPMEPVLCIVMMTPVLLAVNRLKSKLLRSGA